LEHHTLHHFTLTHFLPTLAPLLSRATHRALLPSTLFSSLLFHPPLPHVAMALLLRLFRPLRAYAAASRAAPLSVAFTTCVAKGAASDSIAQLQFEKKPRLDVRRTLAFALFSGAYLGLGQHFVYNVLFTRLFGSSTGARTALKKVLADALVHVPCVYLPLYYPFETVALGKGSVRDGLARYAEDAPSVLMTYWCTWPAVHALNFSVVPQELRIAFVASVSFFWLIYLSYASHKEDPSSQHQKSR